MHRRILLAAFLAAIAFFTAHMVNLMVAHALTRNVSWHHVSVKMDQHRVPAINRGQLTEDILASGVFGGPETAAENASSQTKGRGTSSDIVPLSSPWPPLDVAKKLKLIGTVVGEGEGKASMAVVEEISTKKQTLYRLQDLIPNVGQITHIRKDAIRIQQGAQQELLDLEYAVSVIPSNPQIVTTPIPPPLGPP